MTKNVIPLFVILAACDPWISSSEGMNEQPADMEMLYVQAPKGFTGIERAPAGALRAVALHSFGDLMRGENPEIKLFTQPEDKLLASVAFGSGLDISTEYSTFEEFWKHGNGRGCHVRFCCCRATQKRKNNNKRFFVSHPRFSSALKYICRR